MNSQNIDLRSDTVTLPSSDMLESIVSAQLGDDVFSEDPTVNSLQERAADMMGKEEGLLGTGARALAEHKAMMRKIPKERRPDARREFSQAIRAASKRIEGKYGRKQDIEK